MINSLLLGKFRGSKIIGQGGGGGGGGRTTSISYSAKVCISRFTESNLANWFSSYVQFCSGGHFSERAEAAR